MTEHAPLLLLLPLLLAVAAIPAIGMLRRSWAHPTTLVLLSAWSATSLLALREVMRHGPIAYELGGWTPPIGIELRLDMLSAFVVSTISVIAVLVCIYARQSVAHELPGREVPFYSLFAVLLLGLSGMVVTADLFNLYVFFEIASLAGYSLMAIGHRKAAVSAYRYLLLGTVGASFYLIAVGYLYMLTGSLNMADVAARIAPLSDNPALLLSVVLMVVGVGLKMALFPMHLWLPDAYTYASSTATAIIAPVMTKVSAYVLIRVLFFVYDADLIHGALPVGRAITWLALGGAVVGSVMAIAQKDVKRMLAYSSVSQVAYIGIGIGIGNGLALIGAMLHILNHAAMKCCLFLVTGGVQLRTGGTRLSDIDGLGRKMPWTFAAFTVAALAMIGIPPTNGFFSKWYLALGAIDAGQWTTLAILLASSLLTAVYFFRVLERAYSAPEEIRPVPGDELPAGMRWPIVALAIAILVLGLSNAWFVGEILERALPEALRGTPGGLAWRP